MDDLNSFRRDLLYVIAGLDVPHGVAIKNELEEYYDKEIHNGTFYPNLNTLVERGLVSKGRHDGRANAYQLTDRGQRELKARRKWERKYETFRE